MKVQDMVGEGGKLPKIRFEQKWGILLEVRLGRGGEIRFSRPCK